ncbi:MAG TPA: preprotein translocase subunit YajC, partial [Desulfurivibrionaceae bacterium]|nr:preprotein translocase subunit YajC [Desulfurivibrionaceae bacterium]
MTGIAYAADAAPAAAGGGFGAFIPLILIFVIFYFLLIRPQQKKAKEHQNYLANLKKGDRVITGGGIHG